MQQLGGKAGGGEDSEISLRSSFGRPCGWGEAQERIGVGESFVEVPREQLTGGSINHGYGSGEELMRFSTLGAVVSGGYSTEWACSSDSESGSRV